MNDMISRQTAREALLKKGQSSKRYKLGETWELNWFEIEDALSSIPTIEAEPVKHAHWIEKTNWYHGIGQIHCTCSNCGYTVDYKPGSRGDGRGGKFCDDCGAKMDGESE